MRLISFLGALLALVSVDAFHSKAKMVMNMTRGEDPPFPNPYEVYKRPGVVPGEWNLLVEEVLSADDMKKMKEDIEWARLEANLPKIISELMKVPELRYPTTATDESLLLRTQQGGNPIGLFLLGPSASGKSYSTSEVVPFLLQEHGWPTTAGFIKVDGDEIRSHLKNLAGEVIWKKWVGIVQQRIKENPAYAAAGVKGTANLFEPKKWKDASGADHTAHGYFKDVIGKYLKVKLQEHCAKMAYNVIIPDTGSLYSKTKKMIDTFITVKGDIQKPYELTSLFVYADKSVTTKRGKDRAVEAGKAYSSGSWGKAMVLYNPIMKHFLKTETDLKKSNHHYYRVNHEGAGAAVTYSFTLSADHVPELVVKDKDGKPMPFTIKESDMTVEGDIVTKEASKGGPATAEVKDLTKMKKV